MGCRFKALFIYYRRESTRCVHVFSRSLSFGLARHMQEQELPVVSTMRMHASKNSSNHACSWDQKKSSFLSEDGLSRKVNDTDTAKNRKDR